MKGIQLVKQRPLPKHMGIMAGLKSGSLTTGQFWNCVNITYATIRSSLRGERKGWKPGKQRRLPRKKPRESTTKAAKGDEQKTTKAAAVWGLGRIEMKQPREPNPHLRTRGTTTMATYRPATTKRVSTIVAVGDLIVLTIENPVHV